VRLRHARAHVFGTGRYPGRAKQHQFFGVWQIDIKRIDGYESKSSTEENVFTPVFRLAFFASVKTSPEPPG
jgi:hypothetical protein